MVHVEVSNTYIDMTVNNGSEKWTGKNNATAPQYILPHETVKRATVRDILSET